VRYRVRTSILAESASRRAISVVVSPRAPPGPATEMNELLVGYGAYRQSNKTSPTQRDGLYALGVGDDRIYVDHGLTGTNPDRPGLRLPLAACRAGDTLVVTKRDRLARSLPDGDILYS
jgi:hypothetical protein